MVIPAGIEVAQGEGNVAAHGAYDGPLASQLLNEDWREKHGRHNQSCIDNAQRGNAQAMFRMEAALWRQNAMDAHVDNKQQEPLNVEWNKKQVSRRQRQTLYKV